MRWFEMKWLGRSALPGAAAIVIWCSTALAQDNPGDQPPPPPPDGPRATEPRREDPPRPREEPHRPKRFEDAPAPREEPSRRPRPDGRIEDMRRDQDRRDDGPHDDLRYRDESFNEYRNRRPGEGPQYGFEQDRPRPDGRIRHRPNGPPPEEMDRIRRDDPEMFKLVEQDRDLERESANIAEQIRHQPNKEATSEARKKLAELVKAHFDVRQKQRELRLQRLEQELKRVKEAVEARQAQAEQIIKRRLNELTGEADDISF